MHHCSITYHVFALPFLGVYLWHAIISTKYSSSCFVTLSLQLVFHHSIWMAPFSLVFPGFCWMPFSSLLLNDFFIIASLSPFLPWYIFIRISSSHAWLRHFLLLDCLVLFVTTAWFLFLHCLYVAVFSKTSRYFPGFLRTTCRSPVNRTYASKCFSPPHLPSVTHI